MRLITMVMKQPGEHNFSYNNNISICNQVKAKYNLSIA
jgi:hypothetical protein